MQSITAIFLAPDARDWLANSRQARILHVFDHACNLINERREVLSIVTPQIGNGPFNLVIPRLRKSSSEVFSTINIESPVSILGNQLTLGDLAINTVNAKLWNPRPNWDALHACRDNISRQILWLRGEIASSPSGLLATTLPFSDHQSRISTLCSSLATADIPPVQTITSQLAGLGAGLTPSGDDFLLGAIYAAWIIHPPDVAGVLAKEIGKVATPLTTSLSGAWLKSAGRGEVSAVWHDLFNALISSDRTEIRLAVECLLAIGHTSGADALAGFIGSFKCWAVSVRSV